MESKDQKLKLEDTFSTLNSHFQSLQNKYNEFLTHYSDNLPFTSEYEENLKRPDDRIYSAVAQLSKIEELSLSLCDPLLHENLNYLFKSIKSVLLDRKPRQKHHKSECCLNKSKKDKNSILHLLDKKNLSLDMQDKCIRAMTKEVDKYKTEVKGLRRIIAQRFTGESMDMKRACSTSPNASILGKLKRELVLAKQEASTLKRERDDLGVLFGGFKGIEHFKIMVKNLHGRISHVAEAISRLIILEEKAEDIFINSSKNLPNYLKSVRKARSLVIKALRAFEIEKTKENQTEKKHRKIPDKMFLRTMKTVFDKLEEFIGKNYKEITAQLNEMNNRLKSLDYREKALKDKMKSYRVNYTIVDQMNKKQVKEYQDEVNQYSDMLKEAQKGQQEIEYQLILRDNKIMDLEDKIDRRLDREKKLQDTLISLTKRLPESGYTSIEQKEVLENLSNLNRKAEKGNLLSEIQEFTTIPPRDPFSHVLQILFSKQIDASDIDFYKKVSSLVLKKKRRFQSELIIDSLLSEIEIIPSNIKVSGANSFEQNPLREASLSELIEVIEKKDTQLDQLLFSKIRELETGRSQLVEQINRKKNKIIIQKQIIQQLEEDIKDLEKQPYLKALVRNFLTSLPQLLQEKEDALRAIIQSLQFTNEELIDVEKSRKDCGVWSKVAKAKS